MEMLIVQSVLAFAAGITLNCMPCVLPVMPVKIRTLLQATDGGFAARSAAAAALLAGSLSFFIILGAATTGFGLMWGQLFQHTAVRLFLGLFFLGSAVATFTDRSWRLPQFVYRLPMRRQVSAFLTGALAGILSTPCSGPFLGSVLAFAATRSATETMVIFSAIGTGLAAPLVLLMLRPGLMQRLSFSGRLAVTLKKALGFVLLAAGLFFVQGFLGAGLRQAAWLALVMGTGLWLVLQATGGRRARLRPVLIAALAMVVLIGYRDMGFNADTAAIAWQPYAETHIGSGNGGPALIYFSADWCINCRVMSRTTFGEPSLGEQMRRQGITPLKVDLTTTDAESRRIFDRFGGRAIPYVVIVDGRGRPMHRFTGIVGADTLKRSLVEANG